MVRGILMSKKGQKAVVLTKDGSFQKVRLRKDAHLSVGQSVLDSDIALRPVMAKKIPLSLAACLTVMIVFGIISGFIRNNAIAAYVSIDVNPSLEAAVNQQFKIVNVKGLNSDGISLLDSTIDYTDMPLKEFSLAIADALSERGYLTDHPDIVVSTALTDKVADSKRENFINNINNAMIRLEENHTFKESSGSLEVINTTMDERHKAKQAGVSTGKYLIFLKATNKGEDLTLQQAKNMTVKEIRNRNDHGHATVEADEQHPPKGKPSKEEKNQLKKNRKEQHDQRNKLGHPYSQPKKQEKSVVKPMKENGQSSLKGNPHYFSNFKQNGLHDIKLFPARDQYKIKPYHDKSNQKKGNDHHQYKHAG